jgi:hypothetical protein
VWLQVSKEVGRKPLKGQQNKIWGALSLTGTVRSWEAKMNKVGLSKWDVMTVFRRTFGDKVEKDLLIDSIAKAIGEVIEENNKRLLEDIAGHLKGEMSKL